MPNNISAKIELLDNLSERVDYDTTDYPVSIGRGRLASYPGYRGQAHWHPDVEFIYVYSGEMDYSVNGTILKMKAGEGIFVNSQCLHFGFSDRKDCDFLCILLNPEAVAFTPSVRENFVAPLIENAEFPCLLLSADVPWQAEILKLLSGIPSGGYSELELFGIHAAFLSIWKLLFKHMPAPSHLSRAGGANISVLQKMLSFIRVHYPEPITLADIAKSGGVSVSTCCRLFKEHIRSSPIDYLRMHRVKASMELLRRSSRSISEIADAVGFSSSSYFSETFRALKGMTPREYRQEAMKNSPDEVDLQDSVEA